MYKVEIKTEDSEIVEYYESWYDVIATDCMGLIFIFFMIILALLTLPVALYRRIFYKEKIDLLDIVVLYFISGIIGIFLIPFAAIKTVFYGGELVGRHTTSFKPRHRAMR